MSFSILKLLILSLSSNPSNSSSRYCFYKFSAAVLWILFCAFYVAIYPILRLFSILICLKLSMDFATFSLNPTSCWQSSTNAINSCSAYSLNRLIRLLSEYESGSKGMLRIERLLSYLEADILVSITGNSRYFRLESVFFSSKSQGICPLSYRN